jgi:hypothetical protein
MLRQYLHSLSSEVTHITALQEAVSEEVFFGWVWTLPRAISITILRFFTFTVECLLRNKHLMVNVSLTATYNISWIPS